MAAKKYVRVPRKSLYDPTRACGCKCAEGCGRVPRKHCGRWWCEFDAKSSTLSERDEHKETT